MHYVTALVVFVSQEIVGLLIFPVLSWYLGSKSDRFIDHRSIFKGILERLLLFVALIHGYPQMLIAFAAMKLGTRLHEEDDAEISNTFFLVGNFLSILLAMIGSIIVEVICKCAFPQ